MMNRKFIISLIILCGVFATACGNEYKTSFNQDKALKDTGKKTYTVNSSVDQVKAMKTGWNLGNTLDAKGKTGLGSETYWGQPETTKAMIDGLAKSGIKTIRIPTTWHNHIIDSNYTIDPKWMARVKQIVDWAIEDDMYVILNTHHDNGETSKALTPCSGYYPNKANYDESIKFLTNVWAQISLAFNNGYDEHLIFETMNEPRPAGTNYEWYYAEGNSTCIEAADCINKYNQACLDVIRNSSGNNKNRLVMVPGLAASAGGIFATTFKIPQDTVKNRIVISVHLYTPYAFAGETPGATNFSTAHKNELGTTFKKLSTTFIEKGYPVIIGEYGATNKDNLTARVEWFNYFLKYSYNNYGMISCLWDNGQADPSKKEGERFGYYNRQKQTWYFPEILAAINENTK